MPNPRRQGVCLGSFPLGQKSWSSVTFHSTTPRPNLVQALLSSSFPGHLLPVIPQAPPTQCVQADLSPSSSLSQQWSLTLLPPFPNLLPAPGPTASPATTLLASLSSCPGSVSSPYNLSTSSSLPSFHPLYPLKITALLITFTFQELSPHPLPLEPMAA